MKTQMKFEKGDEFVFQSTKYKVKEIGSDGPCYVCSTKSKKGDFYFLQKDESEMVKTN